MLKLQAKKFSSRTRVLYVAEYEPQLYAAFIRHLGVLEDGTACIDPYHPCDKRWLIPTDAEECGVADVIVAWDAVNLLACAEGYCYASIFGVGSEFGLYDAVVERVEAVNRELAGAISALSRSEVRTLYLPAVKEEECRGKSIELCSASCDVIVHLDCKNVKLDAYISRDKDIAVCIKCNGQCPSECASVNVDVFKFVRDYITVSQRSAYARAFYDRNAFVALIGGYGVLALTSGGEVAFGPVEEVASWLAERGRQYIGELILRERSFIDNG